MNREQQTTKGKSRVKKRVVFTFDEVGDERAMEIFTRCVSVDVVRNGRKTQLLIPIV